MSLLSNLLAFSSLVFLMLFRTLRVRNNKDLPRPTADFSLRVMRRKKLLNPNIEWPQKVCPRWDCYRILTSLKWTLNTGVFIAWSTISA